MGVVDGQLFGGGGRVTLLIHSSNPCSFLAFKYSAGTDVLNRAPCVPCTVSFETCPNLQTVLMFGLRGHYSLREGGGGSDSLEPSQTVSNMKIRKFSSIEKLGNILLLHKYYHFLKQLLVDEKQVRLGLIFIIFLVYL